MRTKPSRFTRLKIVVGYILLLALLLYALHYIHKEMQNLQTLEEEQILNSDKLASLIRQKDAQMMNFLHVQKKPEEESVPLGLVSELLKQPTIITVTPKPQQSAPIIRQEIVSQKDSVVQVRPKKGFFKRVAEVFAPSKDSVKQVRTTVKVSSDSILDRHEMTPIFTEIPDPDEESEAKIIASQHIQNHQIREKAYRDTIALYQEKIRQRELELTAQIDSMLKAYEKEVVLRAVVFNQKQQEQRNKSIEAIAIIAVIAILLVAIFSFIIGRDLTRSARYRRELELAKRHAESLLQAREQMMLAITHDFKAPLSSVIGYTELLQPLLRDESQQNYLRNINKSSQHLLKLVTQLLEFHRLDVRKAEITTGPFVPIDLFEEIALSYLPAVKEKGLQLHTQFTEDLRTQQTGDTIRIRQIIDNLMSNALKFTESGNITLTACIQQNQLILSVSDTGEGISPADKEKIFQAFSRLPNAQGKEGAGLGLAIVHKIAKLLSGKIEVSGSKGKGSTFTIKLPIRKGRVQSRNILQKETQAVKPINTSKAMTKSLEGLNLILIDDDQIQLELTKTMLSLQRAKVKCCTQVEDLINILREERYDYLLTDVQMPAINGFDLLKLLRASHLPNAKELPVIAVTARNDLDDAEFTNCGFAGCLHKPFSVEDFLHITGRQKRPDNQEHHTGQNRRKGLHLNTESSSNEPRLGMTSEHKDTFNFEALTIYSAGDENATHKIQLSFLAQTERNISTLQEAVENGDTPKISAIAHKQLPLFSMINAKSCVEYLQFLEKVKPDRFTLQTRSYTTKLISMEQEIMKLFKERYPYLMEMYTKIGRETE